MSVNASSVEVLEGDPLSISCAIQSGYPEPPLLQWQRHPANTNQMRLAQTLSYKSVLLHTEYLKGVGQADAGVYRCIAKSAFDEAVVDVRVSVFVNVSAPAVSITPSQSPIVFKEGILFFLP